MTTTDKAHVERWITILQGMDDGELAAANSDMTFLCGAAASGGCSKRCAQLLGECVAAVDRELARRSA